MGLSVVSKMSFRNVSTLLILTYYRGSRVGADNSSLFQSASEGPTRKFARFVSVHHRQPQSGAMSSEKHTLTSLVGAPAASFQI